MGFIKLSGTSLLEFEQTAPQLKPGTAEVALSALLPRWIVPVESSDAAIVTAVWSFSPLENALPSASV